MQFNQSSSSFTETVGKSVAKMADEMHEMTPSVSKVRLFLPAGLLQ